jgi:hypothetical protein
MCESQSVIAIWLRDQDSNLGPHGYEPCELPLLHPATPLKRARLLYQQI